MPARIQAAAGMRLDEAAVAGQCTAATQRASIRWDSLNIRWNDPALARQLHGRLRDSLLDQPRGKLLDQPNVLLHPQLRPQLHPQLRPQLRPQLHPQPRPRLHPQLHLQLHPRLRDPSLGQQCHVLLRCRAVRSRPYTRPYHPAPIPSPAPPRAARPLRLLGRLSGLSLDSCGERAAVDVAQAH